MYNKGDRVIHTSEKNWGVGQILDKKGGGNISIFFSEKGLINFHIKYAKLLKLASKKVANNYILNNLYIPKNNKKMHYRNISDSISLFLNKYPLGFYDEKYLKDERNYKYKTHIYAYMEVFLF